MRFRLCAHSETSTANQLVISVSKRGDCIGLLECKVSRRRFSRVLRSQNCRIHQFVNGHTRRKSQGSRNRRTHFHEFAGVICPNIALSLKMATYFVSFHSGLSVAEPKYVLPTECARRLSFACEVAPGLGTVLVGVAAPRALSTNRTIPVKNAATKRKDILQNRKLVPVAQIRDKRGSDDNLGYKPTFLTRCTMRCLSAARSTS